MHRIPTLTRTGGITTIKTKGDASRVPDPWTVTLRGINSYRVVGVIPYIGRAAVWVHQPAIQSHILPVGIALALVAAPIALWPTRKRAPEAADVAGASVAATLLGLDSSGSGPSSSRTPEPKHRCPTDTRDYDPLARHRSCVKSRVAAVRAVMTRLCVRTPYRHVQLGAVNGVERSGVSAGASWSFDSSGVGVS